MRRFLRDNSLSVVFGIAFLLALAGQAIAGHADYNGPDAKPGSPKWAKSGGWRTAVFSRSLGIVMGAVFIASWTAQSIAGWASYNAEQLAQRQDPTTWTGYLAAPDFWNRTLQNWQSELLAVGSFAVLAVFLRQRGSPESKPVGAEHATTADTG